jgi:hypothetical protein
MLSDARPDSLFELAGLEKCRAIRYSGDGLVRLEHDAGQSHVELLAGLEVQSEPAEHNSYQAASAGADDEVKMVAWLWDLVATRRAPFRFDKGAVHKLLDNDEHGIAAHTTAIFRSTVLADTVTTRCGIDGDGRLTEREHAQRRAFGGVPPPDTVRVLHDANRGWWGGACWRGGLVVAAAAPAKGK